MPTRNALWTYGSGPLPSLRSLGSTPTCGSSPISSSRSSFFSFDNYPVCEFVAILCFCLLILFFFLHNLKIVAAGMTKQCALSSITGRRPWRKGSPTNLRYVGLCLKCWASWNFKNFSDSNENPFRRYCGFWYCSFVDETWVFFFVLVAVEPVHGQGSQRFLLFQLACLFPLVVNLFVSIGLV